MFIKGRKLEGKDILWYTKISYWVIGVLYWLYLYVYFAMTFIYIFFYNLQFFIIFNINYYQYNFIKFKKICRLMINKIKLSNFDLDFSIIIYLRGILQLPI